MEKAIIYCRVSSSKQKKEGDSLERQEKECREYCKLNSLDVIEVYKEAFSGKNTSRPELDKAIEFCKDNKINYFIIFDIDRLTRKGYGGYSEIKEKLENQNVKLKDAKNIIGEKKITIKNENLDLGKYRWNNESPSEYTEALLSTQAEIEGRKILQRTIPKEILLEQEGYHVRAPNFGYINQKIKGSNGKKTIQIKDSINGDFVIEIFNKRAQGVNDIEICNILNAKGFKNKADKKLNVKYLQELIKKPVYAGIINYEWNGGKPTRTQYEGLVSIDTWNKANKGKIKIIDNGDDNIKIIYKNKGDEISEEYIKQKRKDYNPEFPYSKVLKCPICGGILTSNTSRSKNKELHYYYQCTGKKGIKHKTYSLKRNVVKEKILEIFGKIEVNDDILLLYEKICEDVYNEQIEDFNKDNILIEKQINKLKQEKENILSQIDQVINYPIILDKKNKDLEKLNLEILNLENKLKTYKKQMSVDNFKEYSKSIIKHIDRFVLQKENPELISIAFELVFGGNIEFEKLSYQTHEVLQYFSILSQQKNPSCDEFSLNSKWHPH